MSNTQTSGNPHFHYIQSVKEAEALLSNKVNVYGAKNGLSIRLKEVFHMARIAPALLSCLRESIRALEEHVYLTEVVLQPHERSIAAQDLDVIGNLLAHCETVMEVADLGAPPYGETYH